MSELTPAVGTARVFVGMRLARVEERHGFIELHFEGASEFLQVVRSDEECDDPGYLVCLGNDWYDGPFASIDDEFVLKDFSAWASHSGLFFDDEPKVIREVDPGQQATDGPYDTEVYVIADGREWRVSFNGDGSLRYKEV